MFSIGTRSLMNCEINSCVSCRAAIRQHLEADPQSQRSLAPKPALARRYMIDPGPQQQVGSMARHRRCHLADEFWRRCAVSGSRNFRAAAAA